MRQTDCRFCAVGQAGPRARQGGSLWGSRAGTRMHGRTRDASISVTGSGRRQRGRKSTGILGEAGGRPAANEVAVRARLVWRNEPGEASARV